MSAGLMQWPSVRFCGSSALRGGPALPLGLHAIGQARQVELVAQHGQVGHELAHHAGHEGAVVVSVVLQCDERCAQLTANGTLGGQQVGGGLLLELLQLFIRGQLGDAFLSAFVWGYRGTE